jgi:hypothetical protein
MRRSYPQDRIIDDESPDHDDGPDLPFGADSSLGAIEYRHSAGLPSAIRNVHFEPIGLGTRDHLMFG